jgi:uncharacterized protein (TIGR02118 family)
LVKISIFLVRRPGTSPEEFSAYWKERHAPLLLSLPEFSVHVRRYTQQHVVRGLPEDVPVLEYDGVAEMWVDKAEDIFELLQSSTYQQVVVSDEEKFLDRSKTTLLLTTEHHVI